MLFWYLLLIAVPVALVGYLIWRHRRQSAERAAASAGRLVAILNDSGVEPADADSMSSRAQASGASPAAPGLGVRHRMLSPPQTLAYYLLRTALADHIVLAHVALDAVLEPDAAAASGSDENRRRLAAHVVDFVIADKSTKPVAVVEMRARDAESHATTVRRQWIVRAGLRYILFDPGALPRKEAIREIVFGATGPHAMAQVAGDETA